MDQETSTPVAIVNERWRTIIGRAETLWESEFSCRARNRCGRSSALPEPPIIPHGESRRNRASMCLSSRIIPTP